MSVPSEEMAALQLQYAALEQRCAQLERINESLMNRVERDMDQQGNSFSLFQTATVLEGRVRERTAALTQALRDLEVSNRELQASNVAAEAASKAKSAFLAAMSHELRTPMNGVVGMSELLLCTPLAEQQRHYTKTIRSSALSLLQILNDILDFSKVEAGHMTLEAVHFDLRQCVRNVLALLQPQLESKGLALMVVWSADLPARVIGDPIRFAQVLNNLLGNALKFTEDGRICVRASIAERDGSAMLIRVEVEDTGIGIDATVLPRLFSSFTQSDSSVTRKYGGTGLGLAIVKRICELMGGSCGASSQPGAGSRFWFTVRVPAAVGVNAPDLELTAPNAVALALVGRAMPHVLLVEDNLINQEVAGGLLERLGCTYDVANDGARALQLLSEPHSFGLVLMDCQMPVMDGFEATRRFREYEAAQGGHLPIVALTANAMSGDREQCLAAGMDDFMSKPFQLAALSRMILHWTGPVAVSAPGREGVAA